MAELNATSKTDTAKEGPTEYKEFVVYGGTRTGLLNQDWTAASAASANLTREDVLTILKDVSKEKKRQRWLKRLGLGFLLALLVAGMTTFSVILYKSMAKLQKEMDQREMNETKVADLLEEINKMRSNISRIGDVTNQHGDQEAQLLVEIDNMKRNISRIENAEIQHGEQEAQVNQLKVEIYKMRSNISRIEDVTNQLSQKALLKLDIDNLRSNGTITAILNNGKIAAIFDDHVYMFDKSVGQMKFDDAQKFCKDQRMSLPKVDSEEESNFISKFFKKAMPGQNIWIGAQRDENNTSLWNWIGSDSPAWSPRSESLYQNWEPSQPGTNEDEKCGVMFIRSNGKWQDYPCSSTFYAICEGQINSHGDLEKTQVEEVDNIKGNIFRIEDVISKHGDQMAQLKLEIDNMRSKVTTIEAELKNVKIAAIFEDHVYMFDKSAGKMKFDDAQKFCEDQRMSLPKVDSEEESNFIMNFFKKVMPGQNTWIGVQRVENSTSLWNWIGSDSPAWSPRSESLYQNWEPSQPGTNEDEKCGVMFVRSNGKWHDYPCSSLFYAICEGLQIEI